MTTRPRIPVAIDARWAQSRERGGVARWVRSIVPRLSDDVDFLAMVDPSWGPLDLPVPTLPLSLPVRSRALIWLNTCAARALRGMPRLFHSPYNFVPLRHAGPSVLSIPDISYVTHPHLFSRAKGSAYRANARWSIGRAAVVTTVTEWSRHQILDEYRLPPERVCVVANGVESDFRPIVDGDVAAWQDVLKRRGVMAPYLVTLGGATRRGSDIAAAAWRKLRGKGLDHSLVVLDDDGPPEPGLSWIPRPTQDELRLLLAGADLMLYPTETESFGMPGLEAVASGTPTVCPRVGALPEVLGDAAAWCERDADSVAEAAERVLDDPDFASVLKERGRERARKWTWDAAAEQLLGVYTDVWQEAAPRLLPHS